MAVMAYVGDTDDMEDAYLRQMIDDNEKVVSVPLAELSDSHGFVSGPPCPPWSSRGRRIGATDERATVFDRCIEWIGELARHGLLFFILENVVGILYVLPKSDSTERLTK